MRDHDLLPCPFCGGDNLDVVGNDYVACDDCGADGPSCGLRMREGLAAAAWNTRTPDPRITALEEEVERLREKLRLKIVPADPIVLEDDAALTKTTQDKGERA